jgi:Flp pilus assembly protein TadG
VWQNSGFATTLRGGDREPDNEMTRPQRTRASGGTVRSGAPRGRERGAVLVETAIVLPVLLMMVFAILEIGMTLRTSTVTSSSTRAGARYAAANYALATTPAARLTLRDRQSGDTPQVLYIYRAGATGAPAAGSFASCTTDCLRYAWNGANFVYQGGTWDTPDACGAAINSVGVYVTVLHNTRNTFIPLSTTVDEYTVMRLEPKDPILCPNGES